MDVKQAANVLELIEFFAQHGRPATLAEIARQLSWPRSSAFNLVGTLTGRGYLYEPRAREGYYPSPKWSLLLDQIQRAAPVPAKLRGLMQTLWSQTGETIVLAGISGVHALFVDTLESSQPVRYTAPIGKQVPLHVTATGRALLSLMSDPDRASILRRAVFERYTSATLMSVQAVEDEIFRSKQRGWFEGLAEYTADLGGVAMPLQLPHRDLALLVGGPMFRIHPRREAIAAVMHEEIDRYLKTPGPGD
ncbi:IclR family transcriptional regulator [soil metagenome]